MSRRTHTGLGALSAAAGAVAIGVLALGALTSQPSLRTPSTTQRLPGSATTRRS